MKISTATSVFVNFLLRDAVEQCIKLGLDGLDLWCGRPHLYRRDYEEKTLNRIRDIIGRSGLEVVAAMPAFFRYPFSLSSPVERIREDSIAYMKDCIDNAVLMGAQHVLVVPTNSIAGQTDKMAKSAFLHSLEKVCAYAQTRNMKLGVETVYPRLCSYMHHTKQALSLIRDLQTDILGVVLDTGHLNLSGEGFEAAADNLGDRLLEVHINDNNAKEQQNAIPGEGNIDFKGIFAALDKRGYRGFVTLELGWYYSFNPVAAVTEAVSRVRNMAGAA